MKQLNLRARDGGYSINFMYALLHNIHDYFLSSVYKLTVTYTVDEWGFGSAAGRLTARVGRLTGLEPAH